MTLTIDKIIKYLKQLKGKRFIRVNKPKVPKNYKEPETWDFGMIEYFMESYAEKFKPNYYPEYKGNLTKSFADFLFNPRTGKSELLEIVSSPPALLSDDIELDSILRPYTKRYAAFFPKKVSTYHFAIERFLAALNSEYERITNNVGNIYKMHTKWGIEFGTFDLFVQNHLEYLKIVYRDGITIGHLKCSRGKPVWDKFIAMVKDDFGYNLYPTEPEKKIILANRKRILIDRKIKRIADFHENGLYLIEEIEEKQT